MNETRTFVIGTNNVKKLKELGDILSELGITSVSLSGAGVSLDVEETGSTFEENALLKAEAAMQATGFPAIADDSGIEVAALGGEPGVFSARYGGDLCTTDEERYELLLTNMEGCTNREAKFVASIACVFPDGEKLVVRGECAGELLTAPRGSGGFGYDPVFEVSGMGKSMAELTENEKNDISHRAKALKILKEKLRERDAKQ